MKPARIRISRYRPHGAKFWIVAIHEGTGNNNRATALTRARQVFLALGTDLAGYAVMAWDKDGVSTIDAANFGSCIPNILIPDFVRNRLLAHRIEEWVLEDFR